MPAIILTLGGIFLPDTPNSLVERNHISEGRDVLEKVRGVKNVDVEFEDLLEASRISRSVKSPWKNLFLRRYRPQLVMALCIPAFQQLGGNNAITFYAPVLFKSIGFGSNAALFSAVILGVVKVGSTWLSMIVVDRWGRKILFYEGGIQMAACQVRNSLSARPLIVHIVTLISSSLLPGPSSSDPRFIFSSSLCGSICEDHGVGPCLIDGTLVAHFVSILFRVL